MCQNIKRKHNIPISTTRYENGCVKVSGNRHGHISPELVKYYKEGDISLLFQI